MQSDAPGGTYGEKARQENELSIPCTRLSRRRGRVSDRIEKPLALSQLSTLTSLNFPHCSLTVGYRRVMPKGRASGSGHLFETGRGGNFFDQVAPALAFIGAHDF